MTNILFNIFNRQQALKTWKPMQPLALPTEQIQYYNHKIQTIQEQEGCDWVSAIHLINLEDLEPLIDVNYVKYVALKHMNNIIEYIKTKGVVLDDIEWNIKLIIDEILTNKVSEDYYLNTIEIYDSISTPDEPDIYDLLNQAIRLDNKRMIYYLIFKKDEEMADRVYEVTRE